MDSCEKGVSSSRAGMHYEKEVDGAGGLLCVPQVLCSLYLDLCSLLCERWIRGLADVDSGGCCHIFWLWGVKKQKNKRNFVYVLYVWETADGNNCFFMLGSLAHTYVSTCSSKISHLTTRYCRYSKFRKTKNEKQTNEKLMSVGFSAASVEDDSSSLIGPLIRSLQTRSFVSYPDHVRGTQ